MFRKYDKLRYYKLKDESQVPHSKTRYYPIIN